MLGFGALGEFGFSEFPAAAIYLELLETATALLDAGFHQPAVVIAHTACEVCASRAVEILIEQQFSPEFADVFDGCLNGYNLGNERFRKLFVVLSGQSDLVVQGFWPQFLLSVRRRNDVVHAGKNVTPDDAKKSVEACRGLVTFLVERLQMPTQRRAYDET